MAKGRYGQWDENVGLGDCNVFVVLPRSSSFGDTASCRARRGNVGSCERARRSNVPCEALASLPMDNAETVDVPCEALASLPRDKAETVDVPCEALAFLSMDKAKTVGALSICT